MKKAAVLAMVLLLTGCDNARSHIDRGLQLRADLLAADSCSFTAEITADYGDILHSFEMDCTGDSNGDLTFCVIQPDSIAGISGKITDEGGLLTFDDTALEFPLLADGQLSPVSSPWIFLKTLRSGYLTSAGADGELLRLTIDDSYEEDALHLDIWLNGENLPVRADILYDGRRILSLVIRDFRIG